MYDIYFTVFMTEVIYEVASPRNCAGIPASFIWHGVPRGNEVLND
jgi:hypothetical protein